MHTKGKLGNLREPSVSLRRSPEEKGYREIKSPGTGKKLLNVSESCVCGRHKEKEHDKVLGSESTKGKATQEGQRGSLSGA